MIGELVEKYTKNPDKTKKQKSPMDSVRIPIAPPSKTFKDKAKYSRKDKHKKSEKEKIQDHKVYISCAIWYLTKMKYTKTGE